MPDAVHRAADDTLRAGHGRMGFLAAIALPLYVLDQITKWWIIRTFDQQSEPQAVVPNFFYLCHWTNTGAAFGSFKDSNTFFIVLSLLTLGALLVFYLRGKFRDALSQWGVALLVAGILGNVTDRFLHGHVVDFLLFDLHVPYASPWPAFNVADSCICIAAGLFIIGSFREEKAAKAAAA